jgi:acyl-CoA synthetase (AMP-forming)/AMP-acid ligase II
MSTHYEVKRTYAPEESIPIGKPFNNTEIVLLDENNCVPNQGEPGEICIRGTCLTMGYFNDSVRTDEVFVQNPLSVYPDRIYRTGDLGYLGDDGELYFISRKDHQIKHMGHRIELPEIEWYATQCDGIEMACAVFDNTSNKIVLFCLSTGIEKPAIVKFLKSNLPRYMMPHIVNKVESIPLTSGGKFDRVRLLQIYREENK